MDNINIKEAIEAMDRHIASISFERPVTEEANGRFCPLSLGDWLELCQQAGVPHVPAEKAAEFVLEDCLNFDTAGEHQERLKEIFATLEMSREQDHMLRLDCCAGIEIKIGLSEGDWRWMPDYGHIVLDDPRAFDILMEYPRPTIPVWKRPWVKAVIQDSYPVEYRAFVNDGKIAGISSYYPQRPLMHMPGQVQDVKRYTEALIGKLHTPFQWPFSHMPEWLDPDGIHCTMDYIMTHDGLLFLEGGPPHEMGAHPCCFAPYEISGLALRERGAVVEE